MRKALPIPALLVILAGMIGIVSCKDKKEHGKGWALATLKGDVRGAAFSSDLPVIVIETNGKILKTEPKVPGLMKVIDNWHGRNRLADLDKQEYFTIGIETRGFSSQRFPKKSFGFEFRDEKGDDQNISILGLPEQSDFALYAPYSDKTLMRNHIAYWLSNEIGFDAPKTRYVELFINEEGYGVLSDHYWGVYLLTENVKRGKNRVKLKKLTKKHKTEPKITGGYLLNLDRHPLRNFDCIYFPVPDRKEICVRLIYPKYKNATDEHKAWIKGYLEKFAEAVKNRSGYEKYIDVPNVIDALLVHEVLRNADGLRHSTFIRKDRGEKLKLGPLWDCNLCMGNVSYHKNTAPTGWCVAATEKAVPHRFPSWWRSMLQDKTFADALVKRWRELRESGTVSTSRIIEKIEKTEALLKEAQARNFERWPVLGARVRFNPTPIMDTWKQEVDRLKEWFKKRIPWMDEHIEEYAEKPTDTDEPGEEPVPADKPESPEDDDATNRPSS